MGLPWLMQPIIFHSSRENMCMLTAEQCAFESYTYHNWYIADLVYGLGTIYLFLAGIFVCAVGFWSVRFAPASLRARPGWQKLVAIFRFSTYRRYEIKALRYWTPTIGVMILLATGFLFFLLMTLGPQPYYWPNTAEVHYGDSPPLATRAGWMSLASIPFIILFASKANMIATLTGVSHEKLIVFHTWAAWAALALALVHTFPFIVYDIQTGTMVLNWNTNSFYWTGVIAILAQAYLTFMSIPWIRNKCYEFFKATHYFMALVFMVFLFIHCDFTLTAADYFVVAGVLYILSWCTSQMKTYFDHGIRRRATITSVSEHALRVDVPVGPFTMWTPGQHVFLRFLTLGVHAFTAHPFTVCSMPDADKLVGEPKSVMTFYLKPRGGLTGRLTAAAAKGGGGSITVPVLLEGAYGGVHGRPLTDYDRALVVACGSGAGFSLPFVMQWIQAAAVRAGRATIDEKKATATTTTTEVTPTETTATTSTGADEVVATTTTSTAAAVAQKKLTVLIATRDTRIIEWYETALVEFCKAHNLDISVADIEILVYLTSAADLVGDEDDNKEIRPIPSGSSNGSQPTGTAVARTLNIFKVHRGRPQIKEITRSITMEDNASVGLAVCGPAAVLEEVRGEAAEAELRILKAGPGPKEVYLYSEVFGW